MKDLKDKVKEKIEAHCLKPTFYFARADFFEIMTDDEARKLIHSSYVKKGNLRVIGFYKGSEMIGYLKLVNNNKY